MAYNWKNNWIWRFESIWCSIEKFKYANELTNIDIGRLLNSSKSLNKNIYIHSSLYIANNRVDIKSLENLLEKDVFDDLNKDLKTFLGPLYNNLDIEKYILEKFRYCPKCIEQGYHSIFHQINFFNKCIFHDIQLQTKCASCESTYEYVVKYSGMNTGFLCNCGYSPISNNSIDKNFKIWDKTENFTLSRDIKNIKHDNNKYIYSSFKYYMYKNLIDKNITIDNTNIYKSFYLKNNPYIMVFSPSLRKQIIPSLLDEENNIYDYLGNIMMNEYINIFKSIGRHIRRKFIKKSSINYLLSNKIYSSISLYDFFNIKNYDRGTKYKEIDENVYAYILWRTEIEGHKDCKFIHKPITHIVNANTDYFIRQNISDTPFYKYLKDELTNYIYYYKHSKQAQFDDYGILVACFERIIGTTLIQYFYDCLAFAKYIKNSEPNSIMKLNISIPIHSNDFLIGYNLKTKHCYLKIYKI